LRQRDHGRAMEERVFVVTPLQIVVGNARAEVVNVVQPNVAGKPAQYERKSKIGASRDRGRGIVPLVMPLPIGLLELMLYIEEPDARERGEIIRGQVEEQHGGQPDECRE